MRDFIVVTGKLPLAEVSVQLDDNSTVEEVIEAVCNMMTALTYEPSTVQPYLDLAERLKRAPTA